MATSIDTARAWRIANPERYKEGQRSYRERNLEKIRAYDRARGGGRYKQGAKAYKKEYQSRPEVQERRRNQNRIYQARTERKAYLAEYQQRPEVRERRLMREASRRAQKRDAFVEDVHPLIVLELDDGVCGICGLDVDPLDFHLDHVIPLSKGGEHGYHNVQIAHPMCNLMKHNHLEVGE